MFRDRPNFEAGELLAKAAPPLHPARRCHRSGAPACGFCTGRATNGGGQPSGQPPWTCSPISQFLVPPARRVCGRRTRPAVPRGHRHLRRKADRLHATRERQNDDIVAAGVTAEPLRQQFSCFSAIADMGYPPRAALFFALSHRGEGEGKMHLLPSGECLAMDHDRLHSGGRRSARSCEEMTNRSRS